MSPDELRALADHVESVTGYDGGFGGAGNVLDAGRPLRCLADVIEYAEDVGLVEMRIDGVRKEPMLEARKVARLARGETNESEKP